MAVQVRGTALVDLQGIGGVDRLRRCSTASVAKSQSIHRPCASLHHAAEQWSILSATKNAVLPPASSGKALLAGTQFSVPSSPEKHSFNMAMVGGFGAEKPADAEVQALFDTAEVSWDAR
jgi:hypothetical protein